MDISMGIKPQFEGTKHSASKVKVIRKLYQTHAVTLSGHNHLSEAESYLKSYQKKNDSMAGSHESKISAKWVMSSPVETLSSSATIDEAKMMIKEHHYHHFPVVDSKGKIIGLISDRDLLRNSPKKEHRVEAEKEVQPQNVVADLMSTRLVVAKADTPLSEIGKVMLTDKVQCVPIVEKDYQLIGIITSSDFIRCVVDYHEVDQEG